MARLTTFPTAVFLGLLTLFLPPANVSLAQQPDGFESLFNGTDLSGWYAAKTEDPRKFLSLSDEQQQQKIAAADELTAKLWRVENGEIVNDGAGAYLTSKRLFRDYELLLEYKCEPGGDSGVYLKGTPQVQIWDSKHEAHFKNGGAKGSGGLWNNSEASPAKSPLVHADNPAGQWNKFRIIQIGARTTVFLNEKLVVDHQIMENYWDRKRPIPVIGPIQLQTHDGQMRWRNISVREIDTEEANSILASKETDGFASIFNGLDFKGWDGPTEQYEIKDGVLRCKPKSGGTIFTKQQYSDFTVRFQFKLPPAGNNGLAIRYPGSGDTAYVGMCELQILDNTAKAFGKLDDRQYHGSAYGMAAAERGYLRPQGQWNFQQVTVAGSIVKVELNGNVILDTDLGQINGTENFMAGKAHPGKDRTSGHFGFAGHSDPVEFRNVTIKELAGSAESQNK